MIAPARRAAYDALAAVASGRADLDSAIESARRLVSDVRDMALLRELVTGTLRWQGAIDGVLASLCRVPLTRLDREVLTSLRLGAYQLLYLDRVPPSAVVDDAVALVRTAKKASATGLVNALLRKIARGERGALPPDGDEADALARVASHPAWLVRRWLARRSRADVEAWLAFDNTPAPMMLRVNPLVNPDREVVAAALAAHGVVTEPCRAAPLGLLVREGNPLATPVIATGSVFVQDEGSQLAALVAPVAAGMRVLDVCGSPGGKTMAYAASAGPRGYVVAADVRVRRVRLLAETVARGRATRAGVVHIAEAGPLPFRQAFDVVVVDAPCSGLGTLRRDPDIKWRRMPEDLVGFAARQFDLLQRAAVAVRPGGFLVYTTCSSEPDENVDVVARFLAAVPTFVLRRADAGPDGARVAAFTGADGLFATDPVTHGLECYFGAVFVRADVGPSGGPVVQ
ncbi:MAG TPA: transcription antitermination factor NusB [Vicinamibacterales bacterium]|nr:transcription antitermination factor NusB [Vicinamibacterales bacterium]